MGFGFGLSLSTLMIMMPIVLGAKDMAIGMGAITQVRVLGGTISLAICATILNNHVKSHMSSILSPEQLTRVTQSTANIDNLDPEIQRAVRRVFEAGYNQQLKAMAGFCGAGLLSLAMLVERKPRRIIPS
ncbi:MAG: hypothetical protein M1818_002072 [Claussenomyces sp. TS43310]|nr:MAG: hypothetical protein M1818_002072 [Claussenomyces sp. TS43310]